MLPSTFLLLNVCISNWSQRSAGAYCCLYWGRVPPLFRDLEQGLLHPARHGMHWRCSAHHCLWKMANSSIPFCLHQILKELCCFYIWGFFSLKCLLTQFVHSSTAWEGISDTPWICFSFFLWLCIVGRYSLRRCCTPCHTSVTWHSHRLCFRSTWDQHQNLHI